MPEVIAAILSSVLFNVSLVIQAIDAQESPGSLSFRPALLVHLFQQPAWLLGSAFGLMAVILEIYALTRLPLAFVQPVIAAGVLVLPLAARLTLGEPFTVDSLAASAVTVLGVLVLSTSIPLRENGTPAPTEQELLFSALIAIAVYLLLRGLKEPRVLCLVAGTAYGCTGVFTKLLAASTTKEAVATLLVVLACFGAVGFLAEMSALQKMSPTRAAPAILALTTVIPVVAARAALAEQWPNPPLAVLGLAMTVSAAMWIVGRVSLRR